jgi:hypothetical protein
MKVSVVLCRDPRGGHVARCPSLPGCVVNADTAENATQKMRRAVQSYLCSLDVCTPIIFDVVVTVESSSTPTRDRHYVAEQRQT